MPKLAVEAAENGLLASELASGIARIKGVRSHGVRVGNWLSLRQAQTLLNTPDIRMKNGLRDRAMFATLLGCGLLRSELAALTIPMPTWTKNAIDAWTAEATASDGHLFRPINRGDQVPGERLSEKVVWQMLKSYVVAAGLGISHNTTFGVRRRNFAERRCRLPNGTSEQNRIRHMGPTTGSS